MAKKTKKTKEKKEKQELDKLAEFEKTHHYEREILELPEQTQVVDVRPKKGMNTNLSLKVKMFNKYINYEASDFTPKLVKKFLVDSKCNFPYGSKVEMKLEPNDVERVLKVTVSIDMYYNKGELIKETMVFKPFWIIGFKTYSLFVCNERPAESLYRVNRIHSFSYDEANKIVKKKIPINRYNPKSLNYKSESDFLRAREIKNWYVKLYIDRLNKIPNLTWNCEPRIKLVKKEQSLKIDLYISIVQVRKTMKYARRVYADSFNVKLTNLLNFARSKDKNKVIDINTIMYIIALNATYKNVKIFYYDTLYSIYKLLSAKLLTMGYKLEDITVENLTNLKTIDFSKHYFCKDLMFNDRLLHIMNLVSADEQYYQMKYAYTVQKNPRLLYSEFILKEFKTASVDELAAIIKTRENKYWENKIWELGHRTSTDLSYPDHNFYINNYNVLNLTDNTYNTVEEFLMGTVKEDKDEIARLSKLGQEILNIDERTRFSAKELRELKKAAKKLDQQNKESFVSQKKSKKGDDDKLYL